MLPIYLDVDGSLIGRQTTLSRQRRLLLLTAALADLLALCRQFPVLRPQFCCRRPIREFSQMGVPRYAGSIAALHEQPGASAIILAADTPTLPAGYLADAIDAIHNGMAQWVHGPTCDGGWYLLGWGSGVGTVTLPPWYRLFETGGIHRARLDALCGSHAAQTALLVAARQPEDTSMRPCASRYSSPNISPSGA